MDKFEDVLQQLLTVVEANSDMPVEEAIKNALADMNVDAESLNEIEESFKTLDAINDKSISLAEARKDRKTRQGWITDQIKGIADIAGNDASEVIAEIEKGTKESLDNMLTQNE